MIRRIVATLIMAVIGLLSVPVLASAANPPYLAPPVDPHGVAAAADPVIAADPSSSLAVTRAGFSIGTRQWPSVPPSWSSVCSFLLRQPHA